MAQYYTLEQAAEVLQTSTEAVRKLAEEKKVRAFRDRGNLRFRAEEINELARERGLGSDPDLQLGDLPAASKEGKAPSSKKMRKQKSPAPSKRKKEETADAPEVFDFDLSGSGDDAEIGDEPREPKPGSDSDVRLVADGSDLEIAARKSDEVAASKSPAPAPDSGPIVTGVTAEESEGDKKKSMDDSSDSDVKIVPDESDDDIVLLDESDSTGAPDSGVRVDPSETGSAASDQPMVTEEIDLDLELSGSSGSLPKSSPFELSDDDIDVKKEKPAKRAKNELDSSDDFELTPAGSEELSPLEIGSDEMEAANEDTDLQLVTDDESEEVDLGKETAKAAGDSGISLAEPSDSGISLEQEGSDDHVLADQPEMTLDDSSESEFELTLDDEDSSSSGEFELELSKEESSSEFELELNEDEDSSSEFELELGGDDSSGELQLEMDVEDSDSEFELTLDDSGELSEEDDEKDIFATDFDVPALEDESGSEAIALDEESDLDDSDFDLAIDEDDLDYDEDESQSQVVALDDDEEAADEEDSTVARPSRQRGMLDEDDFDIEEDDQWTGLDEEEEGAVATRSRVVYRERKAPPWGPLPAVFLFPSLIVLLIVGLMGFEMMQSSMGYKRSKKVTNLIVRPLAEAVGQKLPKEAP